MSLWPSEKLQQAAGSLTAQERRETRQQSQGCAYRHGGPARPSAPVPAARPLPEGRRVLGSPRRVCSEDPRSGRVDSHLGSELSPDVSSDFHTRPTSRV